MAEKISETLKDIEVDASSARDGADEFEVDSSFEVGQELIDSLTSIQEAAAKAIRAIVDKLGE
jgi:hypothetical protein